MKNEACLRFLDHLEVVAARGNEQRTPLTFEPIGETSDAAMVQSQNRVSNRRRRVLRRDLSSTYFWFCRILIMLQTVNPEIRVQQVSMQIRAIGVMPHLLLLRG